MKLVIFPNSCYPKDIGMHKLQFTGWYNPAESRSKQKQKKIYAQAVIFPDSSLWVVGFLIYFFPFIYTKIPLNAGMLSSFLKANYIMKIVYSNSTSYFLKSLMTF